MKVVVGETYKKSGKGKFVVTHVYNSGNVTCYDATNKKRFMNVNPSYLTK